MSHDTVPRSFYERKCWRCERIEVEGEPTTVRFDEERGYWLCSCFWTHLDEQIVIEPEVIRPDWNELRKRTKKVS